MLKKLARAQTQSQNQSKTRHLEDEENENFFYKRTIRRNSNTSFRIIYTTWSMGMVQRSICRRREIASRSNFIAIDHHPHITRCFSDNKLPYYSKADSLSSLRK